MRNPGFDCVNLKRPVDAVMAYTFQPRLARRHHRLGRPRRMVNFPFFWIKKKIKKVSKIKKVKFFELSLVQNDYATNHRYNWACIGYLKCLCVWQFLAWTFSKVIGNFCLFLLSCIWFSVGSRWNNCHFFNFRWYFTHDWRCCQWWCLVVFLLFYVDMSSAWDFD